MTTRNIFLGVTSQGKISYDTASSNFILGNANTDMLHLNSNNNVGVGFSISETPTYRLDVSGGSINTDTNYRVNGTQVLNETTLGSSIVNSSLTNFGTLVNINTTGEAALNSLTVTSDAHVIGNAVVDGNLTVNGTLVSLNTDNVQVEDPLIKQAKNNITDTLDIGSYGLYNDGTTKFAGFFRDATDGVFKLFNNLEEEPDTTVNTGGTGYTQATLLVGNMNISNDLAVDTNTFYVNSADNTVGIGITNPTETFEVNGSIGVSGNIVPKQDAAYDLGTTTERFRDLYLSNASLYIGDVILTSNTSQLNVTGSVNIENDLVVNGTLDVAGGSSIDFSGDVQANSLSVTTTVSVTGNTTLSTMTASGAVQVNSLSSTGDINTLTDYNVGGVQVLSSDTLGSGVTNSSLENLGIQSSDLNMGTNDIFNATSITSTNFYGTIQTSSQPNITSLGTLSTLDITGDLFVDTNTLVVDSAADSVGIGITNPSYKLDVFGDINFTGVIYQDGVTFSGGGGSGTSIFDGDNTTSVTTAATAETIIFRTNSLERARINITGDIGIGVTDITSKLHIVEDTDYQNDETNRHAIKISTGTSGQAMMMGYDSVDDISYLKSANTDGNTSLALQPIGGRVGVGTNVADAIFHAFSSTTGTVGKFETTAAGTAASIYINSERATAGNNSFIQFTNDDQTIGQLLSYITDTTNYYGELRFLTKGSGGLTQKMVIDEDGNVGIGTSVPTNVLTVQAEEPQLDLRDNSGVRLQIGYSETNTLLSNSLPSQIVVGTGGDIMYSARTSAQADHVFYTRSGTTPTERMRIDENGINMTNGYVGGSITANTIGNLGFILLDTDSNTSLNTVTFTNFVISLDNQSTSNFAMYKVIFMGQFTQTTNAFIDLRFHDTGGEMSAANGHWSEYRAIDGTLAFIGTGAQALIGYNFVGTAGTYTYSGNFDLTLQTGLANPQLRVNLQGKTITGSTNSGVSSNTVARLTTSETIATRITGFGFRPTNISAGDIYVRVYRML